MIVRSLAYPFEILQEEVARFPLRADANLNAYDFAKALESTIERLKQEEVKDELAEVEAMNEACEAGEEAERDA